MPQIDVKAIKLEIEAGLPNEKERLDDRRRYLDFYQGFFKAYATREENLYHKRADHRRTSRIMRRIVSCLTGSIYKKPPTRTLAAGPDASNWLGRVYRKSGMAAIWPKADAVALVGDVAALQFVGTDDPEVPVEVILWEPDSFLTWETPGRPKVPAAVATVDRFDNQSRLRLWTAETLTTYYTAKLTPGQTAGGRAWRWASEVPNEYGTLPFSFVHAEYPTTEFYTPGLGEFLAGLNDNVNFTIDNLGDSVRYAIEPIPVAINVAPTWTPPGKLKPGQWLTLPGHLAMAGDDATSAPSLDIITPPTGFVDVTWQDTNNYIDRCLEDIDIPPGTIRMTGQAASGVALIIEAAPILSWAENRRQPFADYEAEAARKAAEVAVAHLKNGGFRVPPWLDLTARDSGLRMRWAPLFVQLPGVERDRSDADRVSNGYASKIAVLMEREDLTEEEAIAKFEATARQNQTLAALGFDPLLPAAPAAQPAADPATIEPPAGV